MNLNHKRMELCREVICEAVRLDGIALGVGTGGEGPG